VTLPEGLDELFYMRLPRRVRKDATVRLDNRLYEVDLSLRTLQVELRFDPLIKDPIQVFHKGRFCANATPVDLHLNSQLNPQRNYEKRSPEH
jgi:putative transposase